MKNYCLSRIKAQLLTLVASILLCATSNAQVVAETEKVLYSPYRDPLFYALAIIAALLLIFILQLQKVLLNIAMRDQKPKALNDTVKQIMLLIALSSLPGIASASDGADFLKHGFGSNAINALSFLIAIELLIVLYYVRIIKLHLQQPEEEKPVVVLVEIRRPSILDRFNKSVAIEKEAAILTDHDYDGIRELDNALPPWWKYGFILTICWAAVYLIHYHVVHSGLTSQEEYTDQLKTAEIQIAEYRKNAANLVDETNVKYLSDAASIAGGREIFEKNCISCHGPQGQGAQVGPNLTDDYWLHGGRIQDIFKTIKYGIQGKGMRSWKQDLTPSMIAQVASYVHSIRGSNPPNAKKPDGELYQEQEKTQADTLQSPTDSLKKNLSRALSAVSSGQSQQ